MNSSLRRTAAVFDSRVAFRLGYGAMDGRVVAELRALVLRLDAICSEAHALSEEIRARLVADARRQRRADGLTSSPLTDTPAGPITSPQFD